MKVAHDQHIYNPLEMVLLYDSCLHLFSWKIMLSLNWTFHWEKVYPYNVIENEMNSKEIENGWNAS